ncbi:MAG: sugar kinase [Oscillospiraceae bacterium]
MAGIWTMGELLVEIMRPRADMQLFEAGEFLGPFPSGAPAIFIDTAARLGQSAGIIGGVGQDDFGKCLLERLQKHGVDCSFVEEAEEGSTATAFVTYFSNGDRKFIFHINNTPAARVKSPNIEKLDSPDFFHVMGCSLAAGDGLYSETIKTLEKFVAKGASISFDPNLRPELLRGRPIREFIEPVMRECEVLLPGEEELLAVSGEKTIEYGVKKLFENSKLQVIALKRGSRGCTIITREESFDLGVYPVVPKDATGAGDSFDAAFLYGYIRKLPLRDCAKIATAVAALNTAAFGPMEGDITWDNIRNFTNLEI